MDGPVVWQYWEGPTPEWIKACQESVRRHSPRSRLLNAAMFNELWEHDRDLDLGRLCPAHRADFVRAYLLHHFGGLWVDADCVVVRPLQPVLDWLGEWPFLGYKERQGHVTNNFMGAPAGSPVAKAYYERLVRLLRSGQELSWLTLGAHALTDTLREVGLPWKQLGYELVQPICWSNPGAFFARRTADGHGSQFNTRSFAYMLSNNMVQGHVRDHPEADILAPETFFRYLLQRSEHPSPDVQHRRRSMGTSNWQQIPFCVEAMMDVAPVRVLDVGIGFGRWGMLVREFCDEWKGCQYRENWRVYLEGIEAFPRNVEEYHHHFYNWIHVCDASDFLRRTDQRWDLVIFGDVLEHWEKSTAWQVLHRAMELSDYVLVNIPIGPGWERGPMGGNPYEEHKSAWTWKEFEDLAPVRIARLHEPWGRDYGAFLLSHRNPRGLVQK